MNYGTATIDANAYVPSTPYSPTIGIDNIGVLQLNAGTIAGSGTILNEIAGIIEGYGGITNTGSLQNNGTIDANTPGQTLSIQNQSAFNNHIALESTANNSILQLGALTITNTGSVSTSGGGVITLAGTTISGGTVINGNGIINGWGVIQAQTLTNSGIINANVAPHDILIDSVPSVTNTGTFEATNHAKLALSGLAIDNASGTITTATNGLVDIDSTTISGGTINNANSITQLTIIQLTDVSGSSPELDGSSQGVLTAGARSISTPPATRFSSPAPSRTTASSPMSIPTTPASLR